MAFFFFPPMKCLGSILSHTFYTFSKSSRSSTISIFLPSNGVPSFLEISFKEHFIHLHLDWLFSRPHAQLSSWNFTSLLFWIRSSVSCISHLPPFRFTFLFYQIYAQIIFPKKGTNFTYVWQYIYSALILDEYFGQV